MRAIKFLQSAAGDVAEETLTRAPLRLLAFAECIGRNPSTAAFFRSVDSVSAPQHEAGCSRRPHWSRILGGELVTAKPEELQRRVFHTMRTSAFSNGV